MFPKSPNFINKNIEFSHVSQRNVTAANATPPHPTPPPSTPKSTIGVACGKNRYVRLPLPLGCIQVSITDVVSLNYSFCFEDIIRLQRYTYLSKIFLLKLNK